MQTLKAVHMFSGTLPGGETLTLHSGNAHAFEDSDAQWLLAEYPERFELLEATLATSTEMDAPNPVAASKDNASTELTVTGADPANDSSLIRKPAPDAPGDIDKLGAQARRGRSKKG